MSALKLKAKIILVAVLAAGLHPGIQMAQADLLINGNFETMGANGPDTSHSGVGGVGLSAAENWSIFHQTPNPTAITRTLWRTYDQLGIPTALPSQNSATDHVLVVDTSHGNNGLVQVFLPFNTGPTSIEGSVRIWVANPGQQVGVGVGNGGGTGLSSFTTTSGQWEEVSFTNSGSPANLIAIYSSGGAGARFFVDMASVQSIPEPSFGLAGTAGLLSLLAYRRRVIGCI